MEFRNPKWADAAHTAINVEYKHSQFGWIPYTCVPDGNTDDCRQLWSALQSVKIADYVEPVISDEALALSAREKRDKLLTETDYLLMADYPVSTETLAAVKIYRQALRDITKQENFPRDIIWPVKPEI